MKRLSRSVMAAVALVLTPAQFACAQADPKSDVRDLTVGMPIHAIPHAGYIDLACVDDASHKLPSWSAWRECPLGVNRLRAVRFGFDPTTSYGGTLIAGHPVTLTAFVDDAAILVGLEIDTDPKAKPFIRKKAFLLAAQVMSRYGAEDWNCAQRVPEPGERAVGGIFMKQICRKALRNRVLVVERELLRRSDQGMGDFVNRTKVNITYHDE